MPQSSERATAAPAADAPLLLGDGRTVRFSAYRGRWLVLYFYPKDNTPGCTLEGIDFNALLPALRKAGAEVLGVSRDSVKTHANFCAKHGFGFDLVSDPDDVLGLAFDVIREKSLYGRRFIGIERSTFLIDPQGAIAAHWRKVKVPGHAEAVLATLLQRTGATPADLATAVVPAAKKAAKPATVAAAPKAKKAIAKPARKATPKPATKPARASQPATKKSGPRK
jgi:peroxiredoxin Q/BCP